MDVQARFHDADAWLICPVCAQPLHCEGRTLRCGANHAFDIARQGYVNLVRRARTEGHYSADVLERREAVLARGYYDHMLDAVATMLAAHAGAGGVLDAGCGTGWYARQLAHRCPGARMAAVDIVKEGIRLGARLDVGHDVLWTVGDSAHLPFADGTMGAVVDVFAPANYREFNRVLSGDGCLIKVVPGADHVRELREAAASQLRRERYSAERVRARFAEYYELVDERRCTATRPLDDEARSTFIEMTPLLFGVDASRVDFDAVARITVDAHVLVGRPRSRAGA